MTSPLEEARKAALEAYKTERAKWRVPSIPDNIAAPLTDAAIDAYESRLKALGYVMVPREASEAMMLASRAERPSNDWRENIQRAWSAMLSAVSEE